MKKLYPILLILALAAITVAVSYWRGQSQSAVMPEQPVSDTQNQVIQPPPILDTAPVSTADWKSYQNEKYGYSISYPNTFTIYAGTNQKTQEIILPDKNNTTIFITDNKKNLFCCDVIKSAVKVIEGSIETKNWKQYVNIPDYRIKEQEAITFQGHPAYEVVASIGVDSEGARAILIPGNMYSFVIIQGGDSLTWQKITESFKFTD